MNTFEYGDKEIGAREIFCLVSNMVIGFGVLTLPRSVVGATKSSDGWMSIVLGGLAAIASAWVIAKLVTRFPKRTFRDLADPIVGKRVSAVLTLLFAVYMMLYVSYETRGLASIAKLYLFDRTPVEAICLVFLLVLVYGVAGPSIGLLRINILFLPIVLFIIAVVILLNVGLFEFHRLKPFFVADMPDILAAGKDTLFSFLGFEVLLFYHAFMNEPAKTVKAVVKGMCVPVVLYLAVFLFVIGVFGTDVAANTMYPTAELAKQVEVPGGLIERFESIFFTIWVMTLFNTASIAFDVTILAVRSVFRKTKRIPLIFALTPAIYVLSMQPQSIHDLDVAGTWISWGGIALGMLLPAALLAMAGLKGVKGNG